MKQLHQRISLVGKFGYSQELDGFLTEHGHRALKEFELASPRFSEYPSPVLAMVKNYMASDSNPEEMEQHATDGRVALVELIRRQLAEKLLEPTLKWRWRIIEYLSERARHFVKMRENSRFYGYVRVSQMA